MIKMSDVNWRREMNKMLWVIECQATHSLFEIGRDQLLDDEFQQFFLWLTNKRLATTYSLVRMRLSQINGVKNDQIQKQSAAAVSELLTSFGNGRQLGNSLGDNLDPQPNQNTNIFNISDSVKQTINEATEVDDVVEILDTSSEEDSGELSGIQSRNIKTDCENGNDNENESNASMNDVHGRGKSDNVSVKNKIDVVDEEIPIRTFGPNDDSINNTHIQVNNLRFSVGSKDSMKMFKADLLIDQKSNETGIKEDIPIRRFNPNDVPSYGGYRTSNDTTNGSGFGSSSNLKEGKEKPMCSMNSKRFKCIHCGYGTDYEGHFSDHMRTHKKEKPYRCSRCRKRFTHSSHLEAHMAMHKDEFPFNCSNCFCGFFQDSEKVAHEKNGRDCRYECHVCKYSTIDKTILVRPMRTHAGNMPYRCNRCSNGFTRMRSLKQHMANHKNKNLPFYCKGCLHRFPVESEKIAHEKDCQYRRYECNICNKYVTTHKTNFENHKRTHTGEKPFRCEVCMRCFSEKGSLKRHLNNVHNRRNL